MSVCIAGLHAWRCNSLLCQWFPSPIPGSQHKRIYIYIYILGMCIKHTQDNAMRNHIRNRTPTPTHKPQGWGLRSQFSPFRYFPKFSEWWKQWLPEWYQAHIWQVSPQLSCGDTWHIGTWLKVSNLYFCKIKIPRNGEINERSFSNPHPWPKNGSFLLFF